MYMSINKLLYSNNINPYCMIIFFYYPILYTISSISISSSFFFFFFFAKRSFKLQRIVSIPIIM